MQLHTKCLVHDQAISIWSTCLYPTLMLLSNRFLLERRKCLAKFIIWTDTKSRSIMVSFLQQSQITLPFYNPSNIFKIFLKVHIFWEGHKILLNLHQLFDWQYIGQITNNWWRFRKILWPSQNIWTLQNKQKTNTTW